MSEPRFDVVFAQCESGLRAAQGLRYNVFVNELGGNGAFVDHEARLEKDAYDAFAQHLLLLDHARGEQLHEKIVGVYRLLDQTGAQKAGGFYSQNEFDLDPLIASGKRLLELGRSCLHKDYRGGMAMFHLWSGLAAYVFEQNIDILFGTASFAGTDPANVEMPLRLLQDRHLAPASLRPVVKPPCVPFASFGRGAIDRKAAMAQMPSLIKAYLRLGGCVGDGAYLDHAFNTTDVCLVLDVAKISDKQRKLYAKERIL